MVTLPFSRAKLALHVEDHRFYVSYDPEFLFRKADTLHFISEHLNAFQEFIDKCGGSSADADEQYRLGIRAEVFLAEFQQFEALFALILAPFQQRLHIDYLSNYLVKDLKKQIKLFRAGDVAGLTNGDVTDRLHFIQSALYLKYYPEEEEGRERWLTHLRTVETLLLYWSERYLQSLEYNAYKHGVRIGIVGGAEVEFEDADSDTRFSASQDDGISYFQITRHKGGAVDVKQIVAYFNPGRSCANLELMSMLLKDLKMTRLAGISGTEPDTIKEFSGFDWNTMTAFGHDFRITLASKKEPGEEE